MLKRTEVIGNITEKFIGKEVVLNGWLHRKRNLGGILFVELRDRSGIVQIVADSNKCDSKIYETLETLKSESVIGIKGIVKRREAANPNLKSGQVEVEVKELEVFSEADDLPFNPFANQEVDDIVRLKYRYLDLRKPETREIFEKGQKLFRV